MAKCACGNDLPHRIYINNRSRYVTNSGRTQCFVCSPYVPAWSNGCNGCKHLPTKDQCSTCKCRLRRQRHKLQCIQYCGGKCQRCGYNEHPAALQFHHRDPSQKSFNISPALDRSVELLKPELDKCDLLCANCHAAIESPDHLTFADDYSKPARITRDTKKKHKRIKATPPSKEWLAQLLWMLPSTEISKIYGVCDRAVGKWATKHGLTKPGRGWWALQERKVEITI